MSIVATTIVWLAIRRDSSSALEQDPQLVGRAAFAEEHVAVGESDLLARFDQLGELLVGREHWSGRAAQVVGERHTVSR